MVIQERSWVPDEWKAGGETQISASLLEQITPTKGGSANEGRQPSQSTPRGAVLKDNKQEDV